MVQKEESRKSSPFTSRAYDISIKIDDHDDLPISERWSSTFHVSELSRKIFFALFDLIAGECLKDNYTENIEDEFGNISSTLFKNFNLDNLNDIGSLEKSIEEYILVLERENFFLPNDLVELTRGKDKLKLLEFDIGYESNLDSLMDIIIRDVLKSLRDEKIRFWRRVFEKYKEDKEAYDLEFRTKATRHKKDLDKFSKIDIDDYIKKLSSIGEKEKK